VSIYPIARHSSWGCLASLGPEPFWSVLWLLSGFSADAATAGFTRGETRGPVLALSVEIANTSLAQPHGPLQGRSLTVAIAAVFKA